MAKDKQTPIRRAKGFLDAKRFDLVDAVILLSITTSESMEYTYAVELMGAFVALGILTALKARWG